jgi:adenylate cyclase class IV
MYEVERTFSFEDDFLQKISTLGYLESEKTFTDSYYDTRNYDLISKSFWLRARSGKWELKIYAVGEHGMGVSREVTDELEIGELLDLPRIGLEKGLKDSGYLAFCTLTSTRRRFKVAGLNVDVDEVSGDGFNYKIGEVEKEVSNKSDVDAAGEIIEKFMVSHGLGTIRTRGKVLEYLWDAKPTVYKMLVEKGVVKNFD